MGTLGSVSHPSLEVHRLNVNDYCIVGGQLTRDCQWLGNPAPAGPQTAVREESVKRTGKRSLSCPLSQTELPNDLALHRSSPPPSQGCRLRSHVPLHSSCSSPARPCRSSRGDLQHFSHLGHLHRSPLEFLKPRSCCLQTAMQQEQPGANGEHGFKSTTVLESKLWASKRYVRVSRTISDSV